MKKTTLLFFISLLSLCSYAQLPNEGFEAWPPVGWGIFDNGNGTDVSWAQSPLASALFPPRAGLHAAFADQENVLTGNAQEWLVTPAITVPANPQLKFWSRLTQTGNQGTTYQIRISEVVTPGSQGTLANYTQILQTWTETQINPSQQQYVEKLVTLPTALVGRQVHVAFVMVGVNGGDRWLVDDVRLLAKCDEPTAPTSANHGLLTAELSWGTGGATSWEIEVLPAAGTQTFTGVTYNGALPYRPVLLPDTDYKYYVRSKCTNGNESIWVGPHNFRTVGIGDTCAAPIVITTPNFSVTDNTSNYGDDFDGAPGATGCNTTGTFLNGDEVVYQYTPNFTGVISINMSGTGANAGLFVYNSCANIGVSCVAGGTGNATTPVNLPSVSVISGTSYYIVISTSGTTQSTPYTLAIQRVNCPPPTGLGLGSLGANATSANLTWNTNGAASWQVVVQAPGAGLPTGAGTVTTVNTNYNVSRTTVGNALLTPSTSYEYYVRADCNDGSGNFSAWAGPFVFTTTQVAATLNYIETFESATSNWTLVNGAQVNKWAIGSATNNGGTRSMYVSNDSGVSNAFTLTSTSSVHAYRDIQMPTAVDQISLTFDWRGVGEGAPGGTYYDYMRVWIVPADYVPAAGALMTPAADRVQIGGYFNQSAGYTTANYIINAAAYAGQVKRLVFEWRNDGSGGVQPPAAVDNINMSVITCPAPSALAITSLAGTTVGFSWTAPTSVTPTYDYYISSNPAAPTATTVPTGTSTTTSATYATLTPSVAYSIWVRSNCGSTNGTSFWTGPVNFNTPQIPATLGYTQNFEAAVTGFSLVNGTQANKWIIGNAVNNGGTNSLYITNDNGVSNAYTIGTTSVVHAYRDILIPAGAGDLALTFDWRSQGETNDFFRVWMVPVGFTPVAGTPITGLAGQRVQVGGNFTLNPGFTTVNNVINAAAFANTPRRLVFEWTNNNFTGTQPPAAIDNINLSVITCPAPTALTQGPVTQTQSTFNWTAPATAPASYDYYISTSTTAPTPTTPRTGNVPGPTAVLTTLPSTQYSFWVRSNCGGTSGTSFWVGPITYNTPQIPAPMNYSQDFESASTGWALVNGDQTNKWVIGSAVSNGGTRSLYVSNDNGVTNNYTTSTSAYVYAHAYRDIAIPAGTTDVNLSFDWKSQGESGWDYVRVFLVPITYTPVAGTEITVADGRRQIGGNFQVNNTWTTFTNTFNAAAYANTSMRLVFQWRNDTGGGTNPPAAIDNVNFSVITCPQPITLAAPIISSDRATLSWVEQATATSWEVYVATAGSPAPTAIATGQATTTTTTVVTQTAAGVNLAGSTDYVYYVRAVCSGTDKSFWSGPFAFKTAISNDDCARAVTLTVNPALACVTVTPAAFTGATASAETNNCSATNGGDIWFKFVATNDAHGVKLSNFTGTVVPVVLSLYEGTACGSLTRLFCSSNNVINASRLVPGTTYTVRATLNAANPNLTTAFNVCVNTPPPPANNNQSDCVINTINPSFEEPAPVTFQYPPIIDHNTIPGWRTTAADGMMEFWPIPNFENVAATFADQGVQFIELNANLVSGIYQDFATPSPTEFTYKFYHRGRRGPDTIQLLSGPPGGPYVPVDGPRTTGNTAWAEYSGTYTSAPGQTVTRFIFQSVSSTGGDPSVGNFLDNIVFTANNGIISANPATLDCVTNVANVVAAGSGTWIAHSTNPTPTTIGNENSNTTTISGFGLSGTYKYDWNTTYCVSTLEIVYNGGSVVAPIVTSTVEYCQNDVAAQLSATALANHTLKWYTVSGGGTALPAAPTPSTTAAGVTTYYVSQTAPSLCEGPRAAITVTVNEAPAAPVASNVAYCSGAVAAPLTATALTGNTLKWYTQATGGTALATAPTPSTATAGVTTYYVSQTSAEGCEGLRTAVTSTITQSVVPVTTFTLPATVCAADATNPIPSHGTGYTSGGTYRSSTGLVIDPVTGEIDLATSTEGIYVVTYTILPDVTTCNSGNSSMATITIAPLAPAQTGFTYTSSCKSGANQFPQLASGFTSGGRYSTTDTGLVIDPLTGEIDMAASDAGSYTITYNVAQNDATCTLAGTNNATITISTEIAAVTAFNYEGAYCFGSSDATPTVAANFTTGGTFTATPDGLSINSTTGVVNIEASQPGDYTITYSVQPNAAACNPGGSFVDSFTISAPFDFLMVGDCNGTVYNVTASPLTGEFDNQVTSYRWSTADGITVGNDSNVFNVTEYANSLPGKGSFPMEFLLTVTINGCESSKSITVDDVSCMIQKGISPNNDTLNDNFELSSMSVKKLSIFNRYGAEVYSYGNYTNQWYGQTDKGDDLPTGTYFYVIERNNGENKTGWIYVNREN